MPLAGFQSEFSLNFIIKIFMIAQLSYLLLKKFQSSLNNALFSVTF